MLPNLRGAFFLMVTLVFFVSIILVVAMAPVLKPSQCMRTFLSLSSSWSTVVHGRLTPA